LYKEIQKTPILQIVGQIVKIYNKYPHLHK